MARIGDELFLLLKAFRKGADGPPGENGYQQKNQEQTDRRDGAGGQKKGGGCLKLGTTVQKYQQAAVVGVCYPVFVYAGIAAGFSAFQHLFREGLGLIGGDGGDVPVSI